MLNNALTLQIKVLLAILAGTAIASGAVTYTAIQLTTPNATAVCPTICPVCPTLHTAPHPNPIPRERYFKVHKAKLNGERF